MATTHKFHGKIAAEAGTAAGDVVVKSQLDAAEANAKNRAAHTGTQTASTISDLQTYVDGRITTVLELGATPATLNSLNELAAALGDDPNYAATTAAALGSLDTRVDALEAAGSGGAPTEYTLAAGTSSTVTHNKARRVIVTVVEVATGQVVYPVITGNNTGSNTITVDFNTTSIAANSHVALIL